MTESQAGGKARSTYLRADEGAERLPALGKGEDDLVVHEEDLAVPALAEVPGADRRKAGKLLRDEGGDQG